MAEKERKKAIKRIVYVKNPGAAVNLGDAAVRAMSQQRVCQKLFWYFVKELEKLY